ncbi:MAG TPA: hypothetical protein VMR45_02890 [Patescibacteria group bacterium]|nr:hypothetical protein [Patescibacteria group bacterium]
MQELLQRPTPDSISCPSIENTYGEPIALANPDAELIAELVADDLQQNQELAAMQRGVIEEQAALKAVETANCASCVLSGLCLVRQNLQERIRLGAADRDFLRVSTMLAKSPVWLKLARAGQGAAKTQDSVAEYNTDPGELLCGVENTPVRVANKREVPALQTIRSLRDNAPVSTCEITTSSGHKFEVIDASQANTFSGPMPSKDDAETLFGKLLGRIKGDDGKGMPQIMNADQIMQKQIAKIGGNWVYEIRMNNKNRAYVLIERLNSGDADAPEARLVILGSHGGNEKTQRKFINNVIRHQTGHFRLRRAVRAAFTSS